MAEPTSQLGTVGFGLLSSISWGSGDFTGALASRRAPLYSVIITSQVTGMLLLVAFAMLSGQRIPPPEHFLGGAFAGLVGALGLAALYYSLANGKMAVAAPVSAVVGALVPVIVAFFTSGLPKETKLIGFALALVSVWLVSRTPGTPIKARDLGLPIVAGLGFGFFYVTTSRFSSVSVLWPLVAARVASLTVFTFISMSRREHPIVPRKLLPLTILSGVLDTGGNAFFVIASTVGGRVDIAAVLSSLFPAVTILLARFILKEPISRVQTVGIVLALLAIILITI